MRMTAYSAIETICQRACAELSPRQRYASAVIWGSQAWSGADLQGKAKTYSASYARQRDAARRALDDVGGEVRAVDHGRLVTAVCVGVDDYGACVYQTLDGPAVMSTARWCRLLRAE